MKFARYLEETQTPEWKKAYIDYRGLKKRITAIRRAHQAIAQAGKEDEPSPLPPLGRSSTSHGSEHERPSSPRSVRSISTSTRFGSLPPPLDTPASEVAHPAELKHRGQDSLPALALEERTEYHSDPGHDGDEETTRSPPPAEPNAHIRTRGRSTTVSGILGRAFSTNHYPQRANSHRGSAGIGQAARFDLRHPLPLMELLPQLTPVERAFFDKLDEELDKIESFYCEREREMRHRANLLKEQLQELQDHRRAFYEAHPAAAAPYSWLPLPLPAPVLPNILVRRRKGRQGRPAQPKAKSWKQSPNGRSDGSDETRAVAMADDVVEPEMPKTGTQQSESRSGSGEDEMAKDGESSPEGTVGRSRWRNSGAAKSVQALFQFLPVPVPGSEAQKGSDGDDEGEPSRHAHFSGSQGKHGHVGPPTMKYDPEEYQHAKKQLKKAVLECYRGLELLNNYRTLNLIGFRKALKKFEKVTNIPAQQAYTKEKIEPSAFSSGATVDSLIRDMEALFAARFARGDKKKALARLRGGAKHTSHHFSTFRTGMFLGLAVPALADGLYRSFRSDTRASIPGWDALMYIYAIFFIPTLFALLVGTNLLVWSRARINYVFIFELDLRTRMDHRVYFEMPAFLLSLLCYAFWLSFARVGAENVAPTTWPLLWLAFTALVMFNPLPVMFKPSRWWLVKNVGKLLTSGMHRVEFADFWMGDQFCSLVFTLSNLYFVGCVYATGIDDKWRRCTANPGPRWGVTFLLASLPLLVRLVQSVKRWVDSRLITHLINGGKYGSGIVYYMFYYLWREQGGKRGPIFVAWCVFATNYSIYAGAWDLLMDWSLLRPRAPYPFLRPNLLYTNHIPFYYFAIVTNILIRFIWVFYIPEKGPDFILRTFIVAFLEALRRWQWNFLRLENEHLGNIDQYRVTREVPLPYSYDDPSHDSDGDEEEDSHHDRMSTTSKTWKRGRRGESSDNTAAEVDA